MHRYCDLDELRRVVPLAIVVMGVSGCGKSTLGTELADKIGCHFLEGDSFHSSEAIAKMHAGSALSDADRWPWLERLGHAIDQEVQTNNVVVAACSALKRAYRDKLNATISAPLFFVLLDVDSVELERRLNSRSDHYMPASLLSSQLMTLERPQNNELAFAIDAIPSPPALCDLVIRGIAERVDQISRVRIQTIGANAQTR
jgi:gluconokinase